MSLNSFELAEALININEEYKGSKYPPAIQYVRQAELGHKVADFLISKAKPGKEVKEAKKQLQDASKQLHELRKSIYDTMEQLGYETAPKHLWSVIQLIQQAQHMYTASGPNRHDDEAFDLVKTFIRNAPSVWAIANTIDEIAEQKRKLSGQIVNTKV